MLILLHVVVALSSILFATLSFLKPSSIKLRVSYILAVATLTSGTYLIITTSQNMVQSCIMGIGYFVGVTVILFLARRKLAQENSLVF